MLHPALSKSAGFWAPMYPGLPASCSILWTGCWPARINAYEVTADSGTCPRLQDAARMLLKKGEFKNMTQTTGYRQDASIGGEGKFNRMPPGCLAVCWAGCPTENQRFEKLFGEGFCRSILQVRMLRTKCRMQHPKKGPSSCFSYKPEK